MTRILLALVVLATLATDVSAQSTTRSFYNSIGQSTGRATTSGNTTTFRDSVGRTTHRAVTNGNTYDGGGQSIGRATTNGNTTTFRDSSGRTTGLRDDERKHDDDLRCERQGHQPRDDYRQHHDCL